MAKSCRTFDHTADIGLEATADSLGELMEALAEGLSDVACDRSKVAPKDSLHVDVRSEDIEALTVDFLCEVLSAIEARRFLVGQVRVTRAESTHVAADLLGEPYDPSRHELRMEVKAVTYHQLHIARQADRWTARVILDL